MAVYTHLSDDDIRGIVSQYGLGDLRRAEGIAEGVENSNYFIESVLNNEVMRHILTVYEKRVRPEDLPFFIQLMQHLSEKEIACPVPLTHSGGEVLLTLGDKYATIVTFLNGKSVTALQEAHLAQLGDVAARMHLAGRDMQLRRANDLNLDGWRELYEKLGTRLDTIEPGLCQLVHDELHYLETHWPHALPQGIIHADLFPNNVFFEQDRLSGVIDFYFACEDALAYELAICLNCWCFDADGAFNANLAGAMIRGYESVRVLEADERDALPVLARGAALRFLLTRAYDVIFHEEINGTDAVVTPHDPMEYVNKLKFQQSVQSYHGYGI